VATWEVHSRFPRRENEEILGTIFQLHFLHKG
jgi:hypothetical protein